MYAVSFSLLAAQIHADSYGLTLRAPDGTPIKPFLLDTVDVPTINTITSNVTQSNETAFILDPVIAGATIAWQLFQLLTGTYIFNLIYLFAGASPLIISIIAGITILYVFLAINTLIAKIRGV